jgi:type III secretion protein R
VSAASVALIALVPLVVLMLTSFVKISVVLSLVRNAIGAPEAPSSLVVTGMSLVLTIFVMAPVAIDMIHAGASDAPGIVQPAPPRDDVATAIRDIVPADRQKDVDAAERAIVPLRDFLAKHTGDRDRSTFVDLANKTKRATPATGNELWVLAPAFLTTELKSAFAIAVLLFIPFLVIDLVVGLALGALGLQSTSPQTVALPLKLLLFVAVDGWRLLVEGLLRGYA